MVLEEEFGVVEDLIEENADEVLGGFIAVAAEGDGAVRTDFGGGVWTTLACRKS